MKNILLVDNGSLEAAAVLALREVAARLSERVGRKVFPVSLAHSDKVPAAKLGGEAAQCIEPFLRAELERADPCVGATCAEVATGAASERVFWILPFFIGPSRAVTRSLPKIVEKLRAEFPRLRVQIAPVLHAAGDDTLARILADRVRGALGKLGRRGGGVHEGAGGGVCAGEDTKSEMQVRVALVDHGSPAPEVTAVRNEVAAQLAALLADEVRVVEVAACSMERREGPAYDFNEPLLETLLDREKWRGTAEVQSLIIVAQLFLLPGRHAGPSGDIAQICARAKIRSPNLETVQTEPLAADPLIMERLNCLLADT